MSNNTVIPAYDQDIDPNKARPEGVVNRTERNPEGRMQKEFVGTPQLRPEDIAPNGSSWASYRMEQRSRASHLSREIEALIATDFDKFLPLIEKVVAEAKAS